MAGFIGPRNIETPEDAAVVIGLALVSLVGAILFLVGLAFYAKAKGRHPAWGLVGLLSLIGLIVLVCLKDTSIDELQEDTESGL